MFLRQDFHEVRMDDVARASGVGKGTLYRYFPSKAELFGALVLEGMEQLRDVIEGALDEAIAAGQLRRINVRIGAEMLVGMLRGVDRLRTPRDSLDDRVAALLDLFYAGAATPSGRRTWAASRGVQ